MPFVTSSVSAELQAQIQKAEEMHGFIQRTMPDRFVADTDVKLLVSGLFSLVMEHHGAILYLFRAGRFDGSAFALIRPLIECAYRALWIHSCEKPNIVLRIKNGEDVYPGLANMAKDIDRRVDGNGMFQAITPYVNGLHGYTHGGLQQLGRRFDGAGDVRPNYSDGEKTEAVRLTTGYFTALSIAWCQIASNHPAGEDVASTAISNFYIAQYQPGVDTA